MTSPTTSRRRRIPLLTSAVAAALLAAAVPAVAATASGPAADHPQGDRPPATTTPIKHLVVIYQENVSFDHYFATYPNAANSPGEPRFVAKPGTPSINGLGTSLQAPNNPNSVQP